MKQIKPDTPIVIITGTFSQEKVKVLLKKEAINGVLYKPFSAEDLLAAVKKYTFIDPMILVVDDDEAICKAMSNILTNETTTVHCAINDKKMFEIINKEPIDLILLDLRLPGVNGMDLIKKIKKIKEDIYIIIITGHESLDSAKKAIKEKVYEYLTKPIDPENMKMVIAHALSEQKEKRHNQETVEALKKFRKLAVGRELKMAEMKEEMEKIKKERA